MFPDEALEISWKSINKARAPLGKLEKPTRNGKKLQFSRCQLDNCGFQSGLKYFHQLSMYLVNSIISFILDKPGHEDIRSLERPKIQPQSSVKSESYSTRNLLPSYDNSLDNSWNDQSLQNTRLQQKLITPKKIEESQTSNVLILSFTRSGGAFLGQMLNNINPDTFYSIDPLPMAVSNQVRPHNLNSE